jgi:hypothetical protein
MRNISPEARRFFAETHTRLGGAVSSWPQDFGSVCPKEQVGEGVA